jgi:hypothetical protein
MDKSVVNGQLVTSLSSLLNDKKSVAQTVNITKVYTVDGKSYWYSHDALAKLTNGTIRELSKVDAEALGMHHVDDESMGNTLQPVAQSMVVPVVGGGLVGLFLAWLKKRKKKRQKRFAD